MAAEVIITEYGKISSHYSNDKLVDICVEKVGVQTGPFGSQLHKEDYVAVGTPIITVEHLGDNRIVHLSNTPRVTDEDKARLSRYHLQAGDIVFSRVGSVDRRAIVREEEDGWLFSGRCLRVRVDRNKIDPVYLSYFFGLDNFKQYIRSIAVGATMPSINTNILSNLPIYYPSIDEQKHIGKVLESLDNKIATNQQINQTLEEMAQAVFKSWFVDFEPVRAKMAVLESGGDAQDANLAAMQSISGKSPDELITLKSTDAASYHQLKTTANLFPSRLIDSNLGEIPEGWEVVNTSDFGNIVCGKTPSKKKAEYYADDIPFIKIPDMHGNMFILNTSEMLSNKGSNSQIKKLIPKGSVCISCIATVGKVSIATKNSHTNQQINSIVPSKDYCTPYIYFKFKALNNLLHDMASGGSTTLNLNTGYFSKIKILKPDNDILYNFSNTLKPILDLILKNTEQSQTLTQLRDTLLPKLLSGEINVSAINSSEAA